MLPQVAPASVTDRCSAAQVPTLLQELSSHSIQLFAGVDASEIRELLNAASDSPGPETARPILLLGLPQAHRTETIIASAIDQLAGAATDVWPLWFGGEDFSGLNDSALSHQYLPIKLATLMRRFPCLSTSWAEAAIRRLLRGRRPRVTKFGAETEWFQLCHEKIAQACNWPGEPTRGLTPKNTTPSAKAEKDK